MAKLSTMLKEDSGLPEEIKEEMSICIGCGKPITEGGMWSMYDKHLGICGKCSYILLDWHIDSLKDTGELDGKSEAQVLKKLIDDITARYLKKKDMDTFKN